LIEKAYLVLGSNLGDREGLLANAKSKLAAYGSVVAFSKLYLTRPYGYLDQPDFVNGAVCLETEMSPWDLLREIKSVERELGRQKKFDWGPRIIDIDIALWGSRNIESPELIIPHPGLPMRDFFLVPLLDIIPLAVHPITGKRLNAHLAEITKMDRTVYGVTEDERWQSINTSL
jgi:2-amino-4-hydroxy-6-hydroxymethyldihydropteridine diphosphokinase